MKPALIALVLSLSGCAGCIPWVVPDDIPNPLPERIGVFCKF